MDKAEAERVTERIRLALDSASEPLDRLGALVADAYQRRADFALGYGSWAEYADAEFSEATKGLAAPIRREIVGMLSASGMPTRAIASAIGAGQSTIVRDRQVIQNESPAPVQPVAALACTAESMLIWQDPDYHTDPATGEILADIPQLIPPSERKVIGLDGKTYKTSAPKSPSDTTPRRRAITDQFFDAAYDLNKRVESVHRLANDDRFSANKNKLAQKHLRELVRDRDLLQQVINQLS